MLVLDCVTHEKVSIVDYSLRVEVLQHDAEFVKLMNGRHVYFYAVCANSDSEYPIKIILETFSSPEEAFAYIDHLKNSSEVPHDVNDQPGGDPGDK